LGRAGRLHLFDGLEPGCGARHRFLFGTQEKATRMIGAKAPKASNIPKIPKILPIGP
jgi:hypothetical protein